MEPQTSNLDPQQAQTLALLDKMEAEENKSSPATTANAPAKEPAAASATTAERASEVVDNEGSPSPEPKTTDGSSPTEDPTKTTKEPQGKESKFAKAQKRLSGSWDQLAEAKTAHQAEVAKIKADREELIREREALKAEQTKLQAPKYTPQQYVDNAKILEAQAEKLEADGEYDKADDARMWAKKARETAAELRKNPQPQPKTEEAQTEEFKALQKEWHTKAAIDFNKASKLGTPENGKLLELVKAEPDILRDPKGLYYAHRLAEAETSAGKLPALEKEAGELRAKVKELEGKLTINGDLAALNTPGGGDKSTGQMSDKELEDSIRRDLRGQSSNWQ